MSSIRAWSLRSLCLLSAIAVNGCVTNQLAPVEDRDLGSAPVGPVAAIEGSVDQEVIVVRGDTLYGIAFRFGRDYRDVAAYNGITAPYTIYPGQKIRIANARAVAAESEERVPATVEIQTLNPAPTATAEPALTVSPVEAAPALSSSEPALTVSPVEAAPPRSGLSATTTPLQTPNTAESTTSAPTTAAQTSAATATSPVAPPVTPAVPTTAATPPAVTGSAPTAPPVAATTATTAAPPVTASGPVGAGGWRWPTDGRVVTTYAAGDPARKGIDIVGTPGQPVFAANDGTVVYSGVGLIAYGELIIVKHSNELLSAYGHNRKRLVGEGDAVKAGQQIAELGQTNAERPMLHFEIRLRGKPVDPMRYLPKR